VNQLNLAQTEQLKEIGAHLRQLRQEQSISTEEVAAKTFIPSRLLKALEEGQSDQLPEPIFIQGFIRRYADALDQDGDALAKTFPTSLLPVKSQTDAQEASSITSSSLLPYVAYILLLITAASGLVYLINKPQTAKPPIQRQNSPIAQQQQTLAKPAPSSPAPPKASQPSSPIQVSVSLKDESWLRVVADGKTQFEGTLTKGKQQTWKAKKQLTIRAGNAGAVLTSFNQGEPKLLGNLGDVKDVTFSPDN
jgi:cytoskeletal protein RodZ